MSTGVQYQGWVDAPAISRGAFARAPHVTLGQLAAAQLQIPKPFAKPITFGGRRELGDRQNITALLEGVAGSLLVIPKVEGEGWRLTRSDPHPIPRR